MVSDDPDLFDVLEADMLVVDAYARYLERQSAAGGKDWLVFEIHMNPFAVDGLFETAMRLTDNEGTWQDEYRLALFHAAVEQCWLDTMMSGRYRLETRLGE